MVSGITCVFALYSLGLSLRSGGARLVEQIEAKTPPPWEHPDPLRSSEIAEQDAYGHGQQNGLAIQSLPTQVLSPGTADEACLMDHHYESLADVMDITTADFNDCCTRFELGSEIMALSLDGVVKGDRVVRAVQGKFRNGVRDPVGSFRVVSSLC